MKGRSSTGGAAALEAAALRIAAQQPELGQLRVAELLAREGFSISRAGVRGIWKRHNLETLYKRMSAAQRAAGGRRDALTAEQRERFVRAARSRRRGDLLTIAAEVFARRGYEGATLKEIADAAGILPGSMYHHYRSKEELFEKVIHEAFLQLNAAVDRALQDRTDPWERLQAICTVHLEELVSGNAIVALLGMTLFDPASRRLSGKTVKERDSYESRVRAVIEQLPLAAGVDRSLLRLMLLGALNWTRVWYQRGKLSPAAIAAAFVQTIQANRLDSL